MRRRLGFRPDVLYFKPRGVPLWRLEEVVLSGEEVEAIKLSYVDGLEQATAAARLGISQPTYSRALAEACRKAAEAIVRGRALRIERL